MTNAKRSFEATLWGISERSPFDRDVAEAVGYARDAVRYAEGGNLRLAYDSVKWAWFHAGRVSTVAVSRDATGRQLQRASIVQRATMKASSAVQMLIHREVNR
jgi:hypothetical protein